MNENDLLTQNELLVLIEAISSMRWSMVKDDHGFPIAPTDRTMKAVKAEIVRKLQARL